MTSTDDLAAAMRSTTEAFVYAFSGNWTPNSAAVHKRAPECEHIILPSSLGIPKRSKDEWAAYFKQLEGVITNAEMTIDDYLAVPSERRCVCRSSLSADSVVGPYKNEYIWFLTFAEDGKSITKITEFLDAKAASEMVEKLRGAGISRVR